MRKIKKLCAVFTVLAMTCACSVCASAYSYDDVPQGEYKIKSELSCYVNAMGGVEFGSSLLTNSYVEVLADGSKTMTLEFTKSQVTIYSITCDTFIDVSPTYVTQTNGVESGTLGIYDSNGNLITDTVTYTLSDDTAENSQKEQVHYVNYLSFPIDSECDTYYLTLYVNSNVMGTQFTKDGYEATLTVDWSTLSADIEGEIGDTTSDDNTEKGTQVSENSSNTENKDGLNIYYADDKADELKATEETLGDSYVGYFDNNLLVYVGITAGVMVLGGTVLVMLGKKR